MDKLSTIEIKITLEVNKMLRWIPAWRWIWLGGRKVLKLINVWFD